MFGLAWFAIAWGFTSNLIPLNMTYGERWLSWPLVGLQYWLALIGVTGFFLVLTAAGLVQGEVWNNGGTVYRTLPMISPYFMARAMFGMFIIAGAFIGLYNVLMTLYRGERLEP